MITCLDAIAQGARILKENGIRDSRRESEDLLGFLLGLSRLAFYLQPTRNLTENESIKFFEKIQRRAQKEPFVYVIGKICFYGVEIEVTPSVLIPRQETELLVDRICETLKNENIERRVLWDMCTGSGCIAIALKKKFPLLTVFASDISEQCLAVAKKNADLNDVDINFVQGDLFLPFKGRQCHYFVSNPPYISHEEWCALDFEVKNFEPFLALAGGECGLKFYKRISKDLKNFLFPLGKAWLEIGANQGTDVKAYFLQEGFEKCRLLQDYSGYDRFFSLERDL